VLHYHIPENKDWGKSQIKSLLKERLCNSKIFLKNNNKRTN